MSQTLLWALYTPVATSPAVHWRRAWRVQTCHLQWLLTGRAYHGSHWGIKEAAFGRCSIIATFTLVRFTSRVTTTTTTTPSTSSLHIVSSHRLHHPCPIRVIRVIRVVRVVIIRWYTSNNKWYGERVHDDEMRGVCLIWGCQGVVREARLFGTKGTHTLCAYVPLLPNKGARECENASAVRVQPN